MQFRIPRVRTAFTLTELLVAISLLVIVMLSVSTIFKSTSDTVSSTVAINNTMRRLSAVQSSLVSDIVGRETDPFQPGAGMLPMNGSLGNRPPFLLIDQQRVYTFWDKKQWNAAGAPASAPANADHAYRVDRLGFFAAGVFRRQTGGRLQTPGPARIYEAVANQTADYAYVWYGHLWLPNRSVVPAFNGYTWPGAGNPTLPAASPGSNPNNYFASQWILGRKAMLMAQPAAQTPANIGGPVAHAVIDSDRNSVFYYGRNPETDTGGPGSNLNDLAPLDDATVWTTGDGATYPPAYAGADERFVAQSRYDVMGCYTGMTWEDYGTLLYDRRDPAARPTLDDRRFVATSTRNFLDYRFQADPQADIVWNSGNQTASQAAFAFAQAQAVPVFLQGCVTFRVDFAGDFISQENDPSNASYGHIASGAGYSAGEFATTAANWANPETDGVIDYNIDAAGRRSIRWYGIPDVGVGYTPTVRNALRDGNPDGLIAPVCYSRQGQQMPFEEWIPNVSGPADRYVCSWSRRELDLVPAPVAPNSPTLAPQMVRITVQLADTEGRLPDGMTQQYIFPVRVR